MILFELARIRGFFVACALFGASAPMAARTAWAEQKTPFTANSVSYGGKSVITPSSSGTSGQSSVRKPASSGAAVPKGAPTPGEGEDIVTCGITCRYQKANDNLSTQALYLVNKLQKLDAAYSAYTNNGDDPAEEQKIRGAISGFCKDSSEDVGDCLKRYKSFQAAALLQIREAMGKNEDAMARLVDGRQSDGSFVIDGSAPHVVPGDGVAAKPHVPEVLQLDQMEQQFKDAEFKKRNPELALKRRDRLQNYSQELAGVARRGPLVEFKKHAADPSGKSSRSFSMVDETSANTKNQATTVRAIRLKSEKGVIDTGDELTKDNTSFTEDVALEAPGLKMTDALSKDAYMAARNQIICKVQNGKECQDAGKKTPPIKAVKTKLIGAKNVAKSGASGIKDAGVKSDAASAPAGSSSSAARDVATATPKTASDLDAKGPTATFKPYEELYKYDASVAGPNPNPNGSYIRYDLDDLFKNIEDFTK